MLPRFYLERFYLPVQITRNDPHTILTTLFDHVILRQRLKKHYPHLPALPAHPVKQLPKKLLCSTKNQ
jgi:hypothetical protein